MECLRNTSITSLSDVQAIFLQCCCRPVSTAQATQKVILQAAHLASDAGIDALEHTGNTNEHSGLEEGNVVYQLQDVTLPVTDAAAHVQKPLLVHPADQLHKRAQALKMK